MYSCASPSLPETETPSLPENVEQLEPELTEQETVLPTPLQEETPVLEEVVTETNEEVPIKVENKTVEEMRDDVHEILDEIIETDSTVVLSFNMTVNNPLY